VAEDEIVFWTCDDAPEGLGCTEEDEAIEEWLDRFCDPPKWIDGKWSPTVMLQKRSSGRGVAQLRVELERAAWGRLP
jgi:hypothetical protein